MEKVKFVAFRATAEQADKLHLLQEATGAKSASEVLRLLLERAELRPTVILRDDPRPAESTR